MRPWLGSKRFASIVIVVAQLGMLAGIAAKCQWDRARYPRVWAKAAAVDPESLTRGRYLLLRVQMPGRNEMVPFYIPEHAADPSRRPDLYVEVTVPPSGPLRAIQLGTRQGEQQGGQYLPLDLR